MHAAGIGMPAQINVRTTSAGDAQQRVKSSVAAGVVDRPFCRQIIALFEVINCSGAVVGDMQVNSHGG
jgi:hypothetical protein